MYLTCNRQPQKCPLLVFSTGLAPRVRVQRKQSAVTMLYKLCPCCAGYVIVANTVTLVPKWGLLLSQMLWHSSARQVITCPKHCDTRRQWVRPCFFARIACAHTICVRACACICVRLRACTWIRVSLRACTRINGTQFLAYVCVRVIAQV